MDEKEYGVHITHCCYIHGCKYGNKDCPVVCGKVVQRYLCWDCEESEEIPYTLEEIEKLRKNKSYRPTYKQLLEKYYNLKGEK
ncbi:MAG: hypothetical protein J6J36_00695 [Clostridia bacterium]|nr:hypothetical protein [Clostridia bacterium]